MKLKYNLIHQNYITINNRKYISIHLHVKFFIECLLRYFLIRSFELTRKDRLYKNIERMQRSKGSRHFDIVPQSFVMPGEFKQLQAAHHRSRGPWIVKPFASSRGRGIFIVNEVGIYKY